MIMISSIIIDLSTNAYASAFKLPYDYDIIINRCFNVLALVIGINKCNIFILKRYSGVNYDIKIGKNLKLFNI
jgi:hypothetical protein